MSPDPVTRFLGVDASGGPERLLGVPDGASADAVIAARDRRIEQIDRHPQAETPEADEVRLALHAAAAVLLDHAARHTAARPATPTPRPANDPASAALLAGDAIRTIGSCGGWNRRAMKLIVAHALTRGVPPESIAPAIRSVMHRTRAPAQPSAPTRRAGASHAPHQHQPHPAHEPDAETAVLAWLQQSSRVVISVAASIAAVLILFATIRLASSFHAQPPEQTAEADTTEPPPPLDPDFVDPSRSDDGVSPRPSPSFVPAERTVLARPEVILRELEAAGVAYELEPGDATARAHRALTAWSARWPAFTSTERREFVRLTRALTDRLDPAARRTLAAQLDDPTPASIDGGVSTAGTLAVRAALQDPAAAPAPRTPSIPRGSGPDPVLLSGLRGAARQIDPATPDAWADWTDALTPLAEAGSNAQREILTALERLLLIQGFPPPRERDTCEVLVRALSWRAGDPARARVVRWLDDPAVPARRAAMLTEVITQRSPAPGVGPLFNLPPDAAPADRAEMAERYAAAWGVADSRQHDLFAQQWNDKKQQLDAIDPDPDPESQLALAVEYARLNACAMLAREGRLADAVDELLSIATEPEPAIAYQGGERLNLHTGGNDGSWLLAIETAAPRADEIAAVLDQVATDQQPLGPADARAVARQALRGSTARVRSAGAEALARHATEPTVLLILSGLVQEGPATETLRQLLERLTGVPLPETDWVPIAHAVLVERALTAGAPLGTIDALQRQLVTIYSLSLPEAQRADTDPADAVNALAEAWGTTQPRIEPTTGSMLHRLVAAQTRLFHAIAASARADNAERPRVDALTNRLDQQLATAETAGQQIYAAERAICDLLTARLRGTTP